MEVPQAGERAGLAALSRLLPGIAASNAPRFDIGWERPLQHPSPTAVALADTIRFPDEFLWSCRTSAPLAAASSDGNGADAASTASSAPAVPAETHAPALLSPGLLAAAMEGGAGGGANRGGGNPLAALAGIPGGFAGLGGGVTGGLGPFASMIGNGVGGSDADNSGGSGTSAGNQKAVAEFIQRICATELARFPTSLYADEATVAKWRYEYSDSDGNDIRAPISIAERCGLLSRVGIKRVLHAAIEQAWAGAAAAFAPTGQPRMPAPAAADGKTLHSVSAAAAGLAPTLEWCQALPKVELHAHLNGSLDAGALKSLLAHPANAVSGGAGVAGVPDAELMAKVQIAENDQRTMSECFELFDLVHKLTQHNETVHLAAQQVLAGFAADNVSYLELRTTPRGNTANGMSKQTYLESVLRAIGEAAEHAHGRYRHGGSEAGRQTAASQNMVVRLLLSINRTGSKEEAEDTVNLAAAYMARGVVGIDLSGDPSKGSPDNFLPALARARSLGLKLSVHLAELDRPQDTEALLTSLPDRIGHGTFLGKEYPQWKLPGSVKGSTPFELCLTSNLKCKTVHSLKEHHIVNLRQEQQPFCICTDDSGVFATTLSQEYMAAAEALGEGPALLPRDELWGLAYDAIEHTFACDALKESLRLDMLAGKATLLALP